MADMVSYMETIVQNDAAEIRFENCGKVIRDARTDVGVSIRELADRLGIDRGRLSKIENDGLALSMTTLESIAKALQVRPEALAMKCLELRFPGLRTTQAGKLMTTLLATNK